MGNSEVGLEIIGSGESIELITSPLCHQVFSLRLSQSDIYFHQNFVDRSQELTRFAQIFFRFFVMQLGLVGGLLLLDAPTFNHQIESLELPDECLT